MKNIQNTSIKTKVLITLAIATLVATGVANAGYCTPYGCYPSCGLNAWGYWVCW